MLLSAISAKVFLFCILGGVVPTFFWLWFWLREDQSNPEPKPLIISSFILGMIAVPLAIPFEKFVTSITSLPIAVFVGWAIVEEFLKFSASYLGGGHTQAEDEPIDVMIYVITAALGFAAAENALFLISPFLEGQIFVGVITSNIRFIGTTLLHILSSSLIGAALAFSFYQKREASAA